jgi:hypothetical protein
LRTAAVLSHWAQLVKASSILEVHAEQQVGTWQSLPELDFDPGHQIPQLIKIVREKRTLGQSLTWNHPTVQKEGTIELRSVTRGMMRSKARVLLSVILDQMNGKCQIKLILILAVHNALLDQWC